MVEAVTITHLSKSFAGVKAVQDLSFTVGKGNLFAFLGVNGAGKSTTISMICGKLRPDSGTISVFGQDISEKRRTVASWLGVVFQNSLLDQELTVKDNLKYRAALYGLRGSGFAERYRAVASSLSLDEIEHKPVKTLSGGQRRRADIARAIIHNPRLLILDEPTTGLDPQTRKNLWTIIRHLRQDQGLTVLLTTHYMEEASTADRCLIINQGKSIAQGTPLELKNKYARDSLHLYGVSQEEVKQLGLPYKPVQNGFVLELDSPRHAVDLIRQQPELFTDFEIIKGSMDDVFLNAVHTSQPVLD
ncbi:ABC transporter ATP-binding protein [Scardovia inopinata]|uniref:ABC transporter domain-containing protein n=1 Tax=Scardovia inopinata F0304 TaxID=641146 RepID=W5IK07_SCAIO|nr:ABC transporter ATP-binding protein [Scardovia inopinata]EFG27197.1 hypothetical protein HMPREF9020_00836 [Scardovia inopinata F0304]BAR06808.1 putative ABC transporter ATP-binding component [Scardovia inopinata JCM 12537]SUV50869.1 ABC transporter ATP-binding protein [Scardovia inopinata]